MGSEAFCTFGERDYIPDGIGARHQHNQTVKAIGQSAVGRGAVLKGGEQMTETGLRLLFGKAKRPEDGGLKLGRADTDGAAAQLGAVEHMSYALARQFFLSHSSLPASSSMGAVNGWCLAT
jgi:hypothetical protein